MRYWWICLVAAVASGATFAVPPAGPPKPSAPTDEASPRSPAAVPGSPGMPVPAHAAHPSPPPKADPAAVKALDEAIHRFEPERLGWLETQLWEVVHLQGLRLTAKGRYVVGPEYHLRLDLKLDLGEASGELQFLSDGASLWESLRVGSTTRASKVQLDKVLAALKAPATSNDIRKEYLQARSFLGVVPLLTALKERVVFIRAESHVSWHGQPMQRLTGVWSPAQGVPPPERTPFLPDQCVLYLDAKTHWPARLEWWGFAPPRPGESLLVELEFRDARWGHQAPGVSFKPETELATVVDDTERQLQILQAMSQGAAQRTASPAQRVAPSEPAPPPE